ncbi:MAG: aspartate/glutamate racemase family protein [Acidiferrobacterales bacterium]
MSVPRLGVLGGMGPLATADFLRKIIAATPAERDQDHLPVVVYSVPQIPDRLGPILRGAGESPLPAMIEGMQTLEAAGADYVAIPCVTAHHWYEALRRATKVPILHIADATCTALNERGVATDKVGVLATAATLQSGFFQTRLRAGGYQTVIPSEREMQELVLPAIACVKRGDMAGARDLALQAVERLLARDVKTIVFACSELPPALDGVDAALAARCVDTLDALSKACVAWGLARSEA